MYEQLTSRCPLPGGLLMAGIRASNGIGVDDPLSLTAVGTQEFVSFHVGNQAGGCHELSDYLLFVVTSFRPFQSKQSRL